MSAMSEAESQTADETTLQAFRWDESTKQEVIQYLDYGDSLSEFIRDAIDEKLSRMEQEEE